MGVISRRQLSLACATLRNCISQCRGETRAQTPHWKIFLFSPADYFLLYFLRVSRDSFKIVLPDTVLLRRFANYRIFALDQSSFDNFAFFVNGALMHISRNRHFKKRREKRWINKDYTRNKWKRSGNKKISFRLLQKTSKHSENTSTLRKILLNWY